MKHLRAILTVGTLLLLMAILFWQARPFFLQNKVTFLLNQKQYEEAMALVQKLTLNNPDSPRTTALRIKAMTLSGDYAGATAEKLGESVVKDTPQVLYWSALSHWQLSNDQLAKQLAKEFVATNDKLQDQGSMLIVRSLAGETELLPEPIDESRGFRLLFPLEQAVYYAIVANQQAALGRVNRAADLYENAFRLGARNEKILLKGAEAAAIAGDFVQAELLLAFSGVESVTPLYTKLVSDYEEYKSVSHTIHDQDAVGRGGRLDLARALAWAATASLAEDTNANMYPVLRVMAELQQEYPYDRIITRQMAVVLETLHRYDEAYALYKKLFDDAPNLVLGLRLWSLEALPEPVVTERILEFLPETAVVDRVSTASYTGDDFITKQDYIIFHKQGSALTNIVVPESGAYTMTVIARGDKLADRWPLVKVIVDNQVLGYKYIRRESWDCYSLDLVLEAGLHDVVLEYVNGTAQNKSAGVRTLSIRSIYVTKPGAA